MSKEWILNIATNRWGLNKKNSVGPVSEWIRECSPKKIEEWEICYKDKLKKFLERKKIYIKPDEYLEDLGKKLYTKISEVLKKEIEEVSEEDCIVYIKNLVINRTFEGYQTEINTIYSILEKELGVKLIPAPDNWDRLYNVDFYIQVKDKYIGIQIKPISYNQTPEIHKWKDWLEKSHKKFKEKFGGDVFIVFSVKNEAGKKEIWNKEVIEDIKKEIERLS
ncbi:MAG TPA: MjaI family restriction endonuclease [Sulfurihydrogenibium sp.]|uniref:MjaI family restriction endonuclease n=1 Tax=Sulfurihydrogenibium sp. (strain YO3AOP1) TaxID=436114 RepID=UPI0001723A17|nr:MjaI family restriction endonuclease [Sulfurihydrogenibium sp. YO3AOP1]ACD65672.1 conserved hypothetical cytosolic protein [Sulfurihydrogenibium sp. YO3AOP1]HBT98572.1 MjaI family restriction endonuclease [Sulfurihydrogenibium sp.]